MNQQQNLFLISIVPAAQRTQRIFGIPASITIAQIALESAWGTSALARKANNYVGIKATAHAAPENYAEFPTTEFVDGRKISVMAKFARYASPSDCLEAHASLLAHATRYAPAMRVKADYVKFAAALQSCGYSTNPQYAEILMRLVKQFDLAQYDLPSTEPATPAMEGNS